MRLTRPSPAMVVACLALFVALTGSAIALSKGSVGTRALKKGAVTTQKLDNGAVIGRKIRDGSVKGPKLRAGAVTADKISAGAVTSDALATDSVRRRKIAGSAVSEAKLANGAVTNPKLGADSVTGPKVVDGSLGLADIARSAATVSFDPGSVGAGACESQTVPTPGSLDGQPTLVLTGAGWDNRLFVGAAESEANQTSILVCNATVAAIDGSAGELIFARF
jgi:hypothetical protein